MSKSAKRYFPGTPESRTVKRTMGKKITRAAANNPSRKTKTKTKTKTIIRHGSSSEGASGHQERFAYIKDLAEQTEIYRRVDVIRAEIVRQILAPGGHPLLGGDFVTYINLLVQLPMLVFFYRKERNIFAYQKHFDVDKFKFSRGSLKLVESKNSLIDVELGDLNSNELNKKKLFKIFNTRFYVRCFLLDTRKDDQPFFEVTSDIESELGTQYEYVRIALQKLFSSDAPDLAFYSESFRAAIFGKIEKTLEDFVYVEPPPDRGRTTLKLVEENSIQGVLNYFASGKHPSYKNEGLYKEFSERLNSSIEDAVFSASILKKNGHVAGAYIFDKSAPNMFLMLRAYERRSRRASVDGAFRGYSYDTRFNISISQREKIEAHLKKLAHLGKDGYKKIGGVGRENELYGGYENTRNLHWDFGRASDSIRDASYRNFAKSLDEWFWLHLVRFGSRRISRLVDAFLSPIGSQSVSMVDPLFYYGASIYRMPFRRDGGLERLKGLSEIYKQLSTAEKKNFSFEMLRKIEDTTKRIELKRDCIRVVVFFYLTRLFATNSGNQAELDTKVHLYPIDIGGVVVGAAGKISFDYKEEKRRKENSKLPTTRQTWDEEVMFLSSVVLPIRASLRRQYRDLQIEYLVIQFSNEILKIVKNSKGHPTASVTQFEAVMNGASRAISKVCPYPSISFRFENKSKPMIESNLEKVVDLGGVRLVIRQESDPSIFRYLTRQRKQLAYDVSRSLALRLDEAAKHLLQREQP